MPIAPSTIIAYCPKCRRKTLHGLLEEALYTCIECGYVHEVSRAELEEAIASELSKAIGRIVRCLERSIDSLREASRLASQVGVDGLLGERIGMVIAALKTLIDEFKGIERRKR